MPKTLWKFSKKNISQKNTPEKFWFEKGTECGGTFKKFCKEKDNEVHSQ